MIDKASLPKPVIRPATREDVDQFSPGHAKPTVRAFVGEVDGKIIGIGGLARVDGRWFAFCDLSPAARAYKLSIVRLGRRIMADARKMGLAFVYAEPDLTEPNAKRWLASLGFEPTESPRLWKWQG